jgi:hypothetical protein
MKGRWSFADIFSVTSAVLEATFAYGADDLERRFL